MEAYIVYMSTDLLVVDNERSISTLLQYNLQQAGFTVETVKTGKKNITKH